MWPDSFSPHTELLKRSEEGYFIKRWNNVRNWQNRGSSLLIWFQAKYPIPHLANWGDRLFKIILFFFSFVFILPNLVKVKYAPGQRHMVLMKCWVVCVISTCLFQVFSQVAGIGKTIAMQWCNCLSFKLNDSDYQWGGYLSIMTRSLVRQRYTAWSEMKAERFQMKSMTGMDMPDF